MKHFIGVDPLSNGSQTRSFMSSLRLLCHILSILLILGVSLIGPIIYVHFGVKSKTSIVRDDLTEDQNEQEVRAPSPFVIPKPLPFPEVRALQDQIEYPFRIPNAEFSLRLQAPKEWNWRALTGDVVRFSPRASTSPEPQSVITFSAGCFGSCDDLVQNVAESLQRHLKALNRQGLTPRVTHWHVHHKGWIEYSLLTDDLSGQAMLTGVSMRWEEEWLNALRCEMRAPIDYPIESEELLHLAWDRWAPLFVNRCRDYQVLSWN